MLEKCQLFHTQQQLAILGTSVCTSCCSLLLCQILTFTSTQYWKTLHHDQQNTKVAAKANWNLSRKNKGEHDQKAP